MWEYNNIYFRYEFVQEITIESIVNIVNFYYDCFDVNVLDLLDIVDKNGNFYTWRECLLERDSSYELGTPPLASPRGQPC